MIFDAFTFFNELDLLELRLNILDPYVDKFILVESYETFMGKEKPLYYMQSFMGPEKIKGKGSTILENPRFAKWDHKIIHMVQGKMAIKEVPFERHWKAYEIIEEQLQKEGGPEDIAFMSDLDEIWNPELTTSKIDFDNPHSLEQLNYTYYLNMRSNEAWTGTLMTKVKNIFIGFNKLNRTAKPFPLDNGGWHWTNQGGKDQIIKKILAYDHGHEINPQWVIDNIEKNMETGGDYLGRHANYQGQPYRFWVDESQWPEYLKENKDKYKHLCKQ